MQILFEQKINILLVATNTRRRCFRRYLLFSNRARTTVGLYRFKIPLTLPPVHICRPGCPSSPTSRHFDSTVIPLPPLFFSDAGDMLSCHLGFVMPLLLHTGTCLILTWQGKKNALFGLKISATGSPWSAATWAELPFRPHGAPWQPSARPRSLGATAEITRSEVAPGRTRGCPESQRTRPMEGRPRAVQTTTRPPADCSIHKAHAPGERRPAQSQKASSSRLARKREGWGKGIRLRNPSSHAAAPPAKPLPSTCAARRGALCRAGGNPSGRRSRPGRFRSGRAGARFRRGNGRRRRR
jgi:hypothetical protein